MKEACADHKSPCEREGDVKMKTDAEEATLLALEDGGRTTWNTRTVAAGPRRGVLPETSGAPWFWLRDWTLDLQNKLENSCCSTLQSLWQLVPAVEN